jgi:hypothetical protein
MQTSGTRPDEIRWPEVHDYQPATQLAETDEAEDQSM